MAGESDDPDDAAARLEAALERIARLAGSHPVPPGAEAMADAGDPMVDPTASVEEIAARLDGLIDRLRAALNGASGGRPG